MADFVAVIRKAVDGLTNNTSENRAKVYDKARGAVVRQLENMIPRPPDEMVQRQLLKLDVAMAEVEATYPGSTDTIALPASTETDDNEELDKPYLPRPVPGLNFGVDPTEAVISIRRSSTASDADLSEIGGLRSVLIDAVDELIRCTTGSNAFVQIERTARQYKEALLTPDGEMLVDLCYAHGIRLENTAAQIRKQIKEEDFPDFGMPVAEALDSVIGLHGPTVMSTALGRELVAKGHAYRIDDEKEEKYRESALLLWRGERTDNSFIQSESLEQVIGVNADNNSGVHPTQSAALAHSTNNNLLVSIAKTALYFSTASVLSKGVQDSGIGFEASQNFSILINNCATFFLSNKETLQVLAMAAGSELSWVTSYINWMTKRAR